MTDFFSVQETCFLPIHKEYQKKKKEKKNIRPANGEQIDNFIFISYQIKFILVISLFIQTECALT